MSFNIYDKEPDDIIEDIINNIKSYQDDDNAIAMVRKAYNYALNAHNDQIRKSGEKYIYHPLGVAHILTTLKVDATTITAALLHDVVEDSEASLKDIREELKNTNPLLAAQCFGETPAVHSGNSGMFEKMKGLQSTTQMLFGHDHENVLYYQYEGIYFVYGLKTGPCSGHDKDKLGTTLITLKDDLTVTVEFMYK
jgi:hypothetical protein